jgi:hypothetical protein
MCLESISTVYHKKFPKKIPFPQALTTLLEKEVLCQKTLLPGEKPLAPYYTKEHFIHLLQTAEKTKQRNSISLDPKEEAIFKHLFFVKVFSLLPRMLSIRDSFPLQILLFRAPGYFKKNHLIQGVFGDLDPLFIEKVQNWEAPTLYPYVQNLHRFLSALSALPQLGSFFDDLEHFLIPLKSLNDFQYSIHLLRKHKPLFLSLTYGFIEHIQQNVLPSHTQDSQYSVVVKVLHQLQNYILKDIPTHFPHADIVQAFRNLDSMNKQVIVSFFRPHLDTILDEKAHYDLESIQVDGFYLEAISQEDPQFSILYFLRFLQDAPTLFSRDLQIITSLTTFIWTNHTSAITSIQINKPLSLAYLVTHPQIQAIRRENDPRIPNPIDNLVHLPFLLPRLQTLIMLKMSPPSTFRYFGESLTTLISNAKQPLPLSFTSSHSPAIQLRLQQEDRIRKALQQRIKKLKYITQLGLQIISSIFHLPEILCLSKKPN